MSEEKNGFEKEYSDNGFWQKILNYAKIAGKEVIEKALWLYYALQKPETPPRAKAVIIAALGYFIFPFDAIPDMTPAVGYFDDLGALAAAVAMVGMYIDEEVKAMTAKKMKDWFGDDEVEKSAT